MQSKEAIKCFNMHLCSGWAMMHAAIPKNDIILMALVIINSDLFAHATHFQLYLCVFIAEVISYLENQYTNLSISIITQYENGGGERNSKWCAIIKEVKTQKSETHTKSSNRSCCNTSCHKTDKLFWNAALYLCAIPFFTSTEIASRCRLLSANGWHSATRRVQIAENCILYNNHHYCQSDAKAKL